MTSTLPINSSNQISIPEQYNKVIKMLLGQDVQVLTESEAQSGSHPWDIICRNEHRNTVLNQFTKFKTLGLGNTYIEGLWGCERIDLLFKRLFDLNLETKSNSIMFEMPNSLPLIVEQLLYKFFNISLIRQNDVANKHYDLPFELYEGFLEESMKYTTGDWTGLVQTPENLNAAQNQNLEYWVKELQIQDGDIILDCGCGWGTLPQYLKNRFDLTYIGITISDFQVDYCRSKFKGINNYYFYNHSYHNPHQEILAKSGVDQITKCIFLETIEHGGTRNWANILKNVRQVMSQEGILGIQTIGADHPTLVCDPYINRYIFQHASLGSPQNWVKQLKATDNSLSTKKITLLRTIQRLCELGIIISKKIGVRFNHILPGSLMLLRFPQPKNGSDTGSFIYYFVLEFWNQEHILRFINSLLNPTFS